MRLFGVANHSPAHVQTALERAGSYKIFRVPLGGTIKLKAAVQADVLFFLTYKDLIANLDVVNHSKFSGKPAFLFASVLRLVELNGVEILDNTRVNDCCFSMQSLSAARIKAAARSRIDVKIEAKSKRFLDQIIDEVVEGSFLGPFMSVVYCLPISLQRTVQQKVFSSFTTGESLSKVFSTMRRFPKDLTEKFEQVLVSEECGRIKSALAFVRERKAAGKPVSYKAVEKKFGVFRYEVRYIESFLSKEDGYSTNVGKDLGEIFYARDRNAALGHAT